MVKGWWERWLRRWSERIRRSNIRAEIEWDMNSWVKHGYGGNLDAVIDKLEEAYVKEYGHERWSKDL